MSTPFDTDIAKYTSTSDPSLMSCCPSSPGGNRTKSPGPISVNPWTSALSPIQLIDRLDRGAAAICRDDGASDVARAWRGEEGDHFGDLLRRCGALEGRGRPELRDQLPDGSSGMHRTRRNRVHPDSAGAEFRGPGPRHRRERRLRRSVRRGSRKTDDAGHAGDVDDAALAS